MIIVNKDSHIDLLHWLSPALLVILVLSRHKDEYKLHCYYDIQYDAL